MKHVELFNDFLNTVVNLNDSRVAQLENSVEAIKQTVRASMRNPKIRGWMPQGSWAHKTIIKPVDQGEFDADLVVFVDPVDGWTAARYMDELYLIFREHGIYKDKVRRWSHCVTITYANECKIDIVPCIVNRNGVLRLEVCNQNKDEFELTEPAKYTNWIVEANTYTGNNNFRKVTRLIKYLRDIKTRFTCSSVLLTTLLGSRIYFSDKYGYEFFDVPTALKTIFSRLDDWLQLNINKPRVANPFLLSQDFAELWTDNQYTNFREYIHTYREWIEEAFDERDRSESIAKWRRVFGEDFAKKVVIEEGETVGKSVVSDVKQTLLEASSFVGDLVDAIKRFGGRVLPTNFNKKSYMEAPRWKRATNLNVSVSIRAELSRNKSDVQSIRTVHSLEPLQPGSWLHFRATTDAGLPFNSGEFRVMWRVTNTDEAAALENALRGRFEDPEGDNSRWESLKYRGVHLVEAFIIRKRDERLIGQSDAFRVMIE
jgi:Second Messenger Oligonucleotide or Dinucleotide Synthetase domain/Adenylyl/Guanylyl and SMODS C-terminal sensor domain